MKEDPAVIARRKAFLMSSTPEVLRNKVAEAREREQEVGEEFRAFIAPRSFNGLKGFLLPQEVFYCLKKLHKLYVLGYAICMHLY